MFLSFLTKEINTINQVVVLGQLTFKLETSKLNSFSSLPLEVQEISKLHLEGNVTPHNWYSHIRFENGKVDLVSITLLSEIVYWYRPQYIKDETTGRVIEIKKKFKGDALQKNKKALADQFGLTERQVKDSLVRLEDMGLITREYRVVILSDGTKLGNVLFIKIHPQKIEEITFNERQPYDVGGGGYDVSTSEGHTLERQTNTKTTSEITKKEKNIKKEERKTERAIHVFTTPKEHDSLVQEFGESVVKDFYQHLSEWKQDTPRSKWKLNDSRSIRRWVVKAFQDNKFKSQKITPHKSSLSNKEIAIQKLGKNLRSPPNGWSIHLSETYIEFSLGQSEKTFKFDDPEFSEKFDSHLKRLGWL